MPYVSPSFQLNAFNCPLCNAYSVQLWHTINGIKKEGYQAYYPTLLENVNVCICGFCNKYTIWVDRKMIHPVINGAPLPHPDMPDQIKEIYEEARGITSKSARSSCALLRVALENLVDLIIGKNNKSLNENIGQLVKQGRLPERIQKSMDILRITADAMLHPNVIDLENNDTYEIAIGMFDLLNIVTSILISEPKKIDEFYDNLPERQKEAINNRDNNRT